MRHSTRLLLSAVLSFILVDPSFSFVHFNGRRLEVKKASMDIKTFIRLDSGRSGHEVHDAKEESQLGPNAPPPGLLRKTFPKIPWSRVPNWLTYLRCLSIPGLVVSFYLPGRHVETAVLFATASFTDWLDGFLARRWDITSDFGAFLDPVADKLMVSTALILLAGRYGPAVVLPTAVILAREIAVSALREWMAQRGQRDSVKVGFQGKLKTALTMVSLTVLLIVPGDGKMVTLTNLYLSAICLLYLSAAITVTSGSVYFRAASRSIW
jgi:CDP-diacylglycerol--glycerol-3-phosphate 3-phosphatidyltransferase